MAGDQSAVKPLVFYVPYCLVSATVYYSNHRDQTCSLHIKSRTNPSSDPFYSCIIFLFSLPGTVYHRWGYACSKETAFHLFWNKCPAKAFGPKYAWIKESVLPCHLPHRLNMKFRSPLVFKQALNLDRNTECLCKGRAFRLYNLLFADFCGK